MLTLKQNKICNLLYHGLISSQAWVSFCLALWVWFYQILNNWTAPNLIWLSFFSTLLAYNLAYWIEDKKALWRLAIMVISFIGSLYFYFLLEQSITQVLLIIMGIISILYSLPYKNINLRKIPKLKIFWIASVWALTILLPYAEHQQWNIYTLWAVLSAFFFVMGITIPFDMRDYYTDHTNLKTIPQQYGIPKSKAIAVCFLIISLSCFYLVNHQNFTLIFYAFAISILTGILLTLCHKKTNSRWYTAFWIEGLSALPFILFKILLVLIS